MGYLHPVQRLNHDVVASRVGGNLTVSQNTADGISACLRDCNRMAGGTRSRSGDLAGRLKRAPIFREIPEYGRRCLHSALVDDDAQLSLDLHRVSPPPIKVYALSINSGSRSNRYSARSSMNPARPSWYALSKRPLKVLVGVKLRRVALNVGRNPLQ